MGRHKEEGIKYGYEKLAAAIIWQGIEDYREAGNTIRGRKIKNKVKDFFHSPLYGVLTGIDPDILIARLRELDSRPIDDERGVA